MKINKTKKVYIESYGCQMNKLDSELVVGRLAHQGYTLTDKKDQADVIFMNTCSVRENAEERVFSRAIEFKHMKKDHPDLVVGILGCMAQNHQENILKRLPHVDLVVGPRQLDSIPDLLKQIETTNEQKIVPNDDSIMSDTQYRISEGRQNPFQAYLKVMEGCDCNCTFCIVPTVRGRETSRDPDVIYQEAKQLADSGCLEITLLGQTVNSYGKQLKPRSNLGRLMRKLHDIEGLKRIKFITSHPSFMFDDIISAMKELPKLCKYVHLPAQSGSNRMLKAMHRTYTVEKYLDIIGKIKDEIPNVEIASDFIVGFPGEEESDFEATINLIKKAQFIGSFIFKYSPRPGTPAEHMGNTVPMKIMKERNQILLDLQQEISHKRSKQMIGKTVELLVEGPSKRDPKKHTGRSISHHNVVFETDEDLAGTFVNVKIVDTTPLTLYGERV